LCPDDFCGWPARLRSREPRTVDADSPSDYWAVNLLYDDAPATGELVYESCAEQYTSSDRLSLVYDNTLKVKHAALTKVLIDLPEAMAKRGIYLAGNSEGAIVLGMMDDEVLDPTSAARRMSGSGVGGGTLSPGRRGDRGSGMRLGGESEWEAKLLGRINIAYSLEPNYFTYRTIAKIVKAESMTQTATKTEADEDDEDEEEATVRLSPPERETSPEPTTRGGVEAVPPEAQCISHDAPRGLFGSRWRRDVPTLCINGSMDQFFGRRNSISETIVKRASDSLLRKGDRPHITGDAGHRMAELGMTRAFVAQMEGAKHAMCSTHDFALRELLADFLRQPEACAGIPERWEKDERLEAMMLWHSVVTPNQCSFASMASTEQTIALLGGAAPRGPRQADPIPAVPSFLDLTSSLARLVRGASVPGSPARDLSGTPSESPILGPSRRDSEAGRRVSFDVIRSAAANTKANPAGMGTGTGTGTGVRPGSASQPDFRRYAGGDDSSNSGRGYRRGAAAQDGGLLVAAHAAAAQRAAPSAGAEDSSARSTASTASAVSREDGSTTMATATMTATAATTSSATPSSTSATNTAAAARWSAFGFLGLDRFAARASRAAHSFAHRVDKTVKFRFGSSGVQRLYRTKSAEAIEPAATAREGRVERRRNDEDSAMREGDVADVEPDANKAKRRGWRMTSWLFSFSKSRAPRGAKSGSS
jgi:hypothetical protein